MKSKSKNERKKKIKDIFFEDHHLKVDHELVHCISQPFEQQLHMQWSFSCFEKLGKDHLMRDS
jgi:hypothetical protein